MYLKVLSYLGCYLGQELTARTFHTGVTRKRVVPIKIDPGNPETDLKTAKGRKAGKILVKNENGLGLALFRTDNFGKPISVSFYTEKIFALNGRILAGRGSKLEFTGP